MGKNLNNTDVAKILRSIAAAYELKEENFFRVAAYDRAATAVEHASSEIKDLWDNGKLEEVPGVGKSIAGHLDTLFKKGSVPHFNKILRGIPPAVFVLIGIPGIGPKTALKLSLALKLNNPEKALADLEKAAKTGKIRQIEGFAEESEKDILEGIRRLLLLRKSERMSLPFAWELAEEVINFLRANGVKDRIDPLGSLRRMTATIGDIDLAVATALPKKVIKIFLAFPKAKQRLVSGKNTARIIHRNGRQIDLKTMTPEAYGALLQHFTGSKQHNIHLREVAKKMGYSLSEYGIRPIKNRGDIKTFSSEKEFYQFLGMNWIPPELREDSGEIEASLCSLKGKQGLPKLLGTKDIKGDLHMHSNINIEESHDPGKNSPEEMTLAAEKLGYEYIGLTEHNPSVSNHTPKQIYTILKRKKDVIDNINSSRTNKILKRVFNGLEIDIQPDGQIAIPDKALELLDYAIVSVHSSFSISKRKMTERILRALACPKVKIFGHPTGRKLNYREGYEADWDRILDYCQRKNIWLEINSFPDRLDLPDFLVREAVKKGVKMVVCTDAHEANQLRSIVWGVAVARRGWAQKGDIINTLTYDKIKKHLEGGEDKEK